jgi:molecular chaperone GrpE
MSEHDYPPNADQSGAIEVDGDAPSEDNETAENAADAAHEEIVQLNDRILRLAAELENTRRRAAREKADAGRYAIAGFTRDLLGVADNFERALRAAGDESQPATSEAISGLLAGLRMTEKELLNVFERHGVQRVFPEGEKFDPHLHQAVAQVPSETVPIGHVVDVAQAGFTIGDRVLRAAMVTVSNGAAQSSGGPGAHIDTEA